MRRVSLVVLAIGWLFGCRQNAPETPPGDEKPRVSAATAAPSLGAVSQPVAPKPPPSGPGIGANIKGDPPRRTPDAQAVKAALAQLSDFVRLGATDPTNPWAMSHGLVAFGADLKASDGRRVTEVILADHLVTRVLKGRSVRIFPPRTATGEPVEPHPFLITKVMAETGVSLDQSFAIKAGGTATLRNLMDDAAFQFEIPRDDRGWMAFAWLLSAMATHPAKNQQIATKDGPVPLKAAAQAALTHLEQSQAFLERPMALGRPDLVQKRKQGIYAHTCGGLHFVQAAVRAGGHFPQLRPRLRKQLDLVRFRWAAERRLYRQLTDLKPRYRSLILVQELKFYGHLLETMALAVKWKVLAVDAGLKREMQQVAGDLLDTIQALTPHFRVQKDIRKATPQLYYDLIGDGCHAVRGLRESLVAFF